MSVSDEIERLKKLHAEGVLSDAEFEAAKRKALAGAEAGPREQRGTRWALWTLLVVVVLASGAVLVLLDDISRSLEVIVGGVGVVGAAAGMAMSVMEDMSLTGTLAFLVLGAAIAAVVFAAMAPVLIVVALVAFPLVLLWGWIGESFTG